MRVPRLGLPIHVASAASGDRVVGLRPLVDSGAEYSLLDGTVALELGWSDQDIVRRALDARPITAVGRAAAPLVAYQHALTVLISFGRQYVVMQLPVFLTSPNSLTISVLGLRDFLSQVDFALAEAEQRFCLRFQDRSALHDSW
jgi:hypothetical protein